MLKKRWTIPLFLIVLLFTLTYPWINKKVARIRTEDFGILHISSKGAGRIYKLKLKPLNAEGSYIVKWSDKNFRK